MIGSAGAISLSDALKSNTTLTAIDLYGGHQKKQHKNGIHQQLTLSILNKSKDNQIEEKGATSLSDSLMTNTTLIQLHLDCKKLAYIVHPTNYFCFLYNKNDR